MTRLDLNYKVFGEKDAPSVLILHGLFGSLDNWQTLAKKIAEAGFRVFILDLRNHGRSPHAPSHTYDDMAHDLMDFIEAHQIENPYIVGHSMGGKVAIQFAAFYPQAYQKLVVVDISVRGYAVHHDRILEGLAAIDLKKIETRQEAENILTAFVEEADTRQFLLKNLDRNKEGFVWRINLPVLTAYIEAISEGVGRNTGAQQPTLFMRGGKSKYIQERDYPLIEEIFPQAQIKTIEQAGHWIHAEAPQAFLEVLIPFLKGDKA
ncbi:alpha/beta fold hydrolase [Hugenholtzia roseola]|uniref:alpha/beta fold hydrolase n=1 Tax=Hugenholtzia roseola TaxID=1002 RepID=UPI00040B800D|nr:alpha/beta fold hydrolase [Hugenholtzia roseola]